MKGARGVMETGRLAAILELPAGARLRAPRLAFSRASLRCAHPRREELVHFGQQRHVVKAAAAARAGGAANRDSPRAGAPPNRGDARAGGGANRGNTRTGSAASRGGPAPRQEEAATQGRCYGCGIPLQTADPEVAGFVEPEKYEVKRVHRQLDQLLCRRCHELSHGAMIPAVADFAQRVGAGALAASGSSSGSSSSSSLDQATGFEGKRLLTPDELRQSLKVVRNARALVVLLVDLLDASGSMLGRVRELVGNNPIVLVGTKADLLPEGTDPQEVADWLQGAAAFKRITAVSTHLVSARTGAGVPEAVAAIRRERRGRDVYVIGAANVGKSAFIRALVKDMASFTSRQHDPQAMQRAKFLPVESAMPGTTLQLIPMEVFAAGGVLYDTPGLHLHHRMPHLLSPEENRELHPRRRLRAYVAPSLAQVLDGAAEQQDAAEGSSAAGTAAGTAVGTAAGAAGAAALTSLEEGGEPLASFWWGGLVRIDVVRAPPSLQLVFYGPRALRVATAAGAGAGGAAEPGPPLPLPQPSLSSDGEGPEGTMAAEAAKVAFGEASVAARGGLRLVKHISLRSATGGNAEWRLRPLGDVAVSGVPGWVSVLAGGRAGGRVELDIWAPVGVEAFSRPPLPVPPPV